MTVRAKFKCDSIMRQVQKRYGTERDEKGNFPATDVEIWTVRMTPVYANSDPNHENSKFWAASPGGSFEMQCVNAEAVKEWDIGKEYYFDISSAG